jgi:uncharacterized protein
MTEPSPTMRPVQLGRTIRNNDVEAMRRLLIGGLDPNPPGWAASPLANACSMGFAEIAELLLAHGADPAWVAPDGWGTDGWTAATFADAAEFFSLAERIVAAGAPVASRTAHGYTAAHRATRRGDLDDLRRAIADPAAVDARDAQGDTPLSIALQFRREDAARALVDAGADPDHLGDGYSNLAWAAYQDSVRDRSTRFVELLLGAGADPRPGGYPPTFMTINDEGRSIEVLTRLVRAGADLAATDGRGETVLHRAAVMASGDFVDPIVDLGASLEARDDHGRTPLLTAADSGNADTFARLLARGADRAAVDDDGHSAGELAAGTFANPGGLRRILDLLGGDG